MNHYDIHCHVFNKNVLIRKFVNIVETLLMLQDLIEKKVSGEEMKCRIEGVLTTLDEVTKTTSEEVFLYLNKKYNGELIIAPLMFDLTYADDNDGSLKKNKHYKRKIIRALDIIDKIIPIFKRKLNEKYPEINWNKVITSLCSNISQLIQQIKKGKSGDLELFDNANYDQQIIELEGMVNKYANIKPFFGIDPRREYHGGPLTIETVKEKLLAPDAKFSGIKLYAPAGFSPTDPILMGTDDQPGMYELCQQHNIPITLHNSDAGFACFSTYLEVHGNINVNGKVKAINGSIKFDNEFIGLKMDGLKPTLTTGDAIKERASKLNHPKLWKLVLEKYPKLTINFAHFGGSGQIMEYTNYEINNKKIKRADYDLALEKATSLEKQIIEAHFQHKGNFMLLNEEMIFTERAKLWNALCSVGLIDNWSKAIFELVRDPNHPNAYTDLSCFSECSFIQPTEVKGKSYFSIQTKLEEFKYNFFDKLTAYEQSKFMYGSDFFLAQFFGPTMDHYYAEFKKVFNGDFDLIAGTNPERFLGK